MWIARFPTASAASFTASGKVGWAWTVRATSSALAPNSTASAASAMRSEARGPRMWKPTIRSVAASARIFTAPSVSFMQRARRLRRAQPLGGRAPAGGGEHDVGVGHGRLALRVERHSDAVVAPLRAPRAHPGPEGEPLLLERLLELSRHAPVHPREDAIEELDD